VTISFFMDSWMNRNFKRTTLHWNRFFFNNLKLITVTFGQQSIHSWRLKASIYLKTNHIGYLMSCCCGCYYN